MRKNLSILMLALSPLAFFAQTSKAKVSVHQTSQKLKAAPAVAAQLVTKPAAGYCTPALNCTDGDLITNVTFAGINNTTDCSANGYGDYTAITTSSELLAGNSYPISVTVFDGTWQHENVSAWVDFNNDEIFDANEFIYIGNKNTGSNTVTANIPIPAGTAPGNYRLRVRVAADGAYANDDTKACNEAQAFGETEDYTIVVSNPMPLTGCLNATSGQWPSATYVPVCNGAVSNVTTAGYLNEFSKVKLVAGTQYTFSTSVDTYFITISDEAGTTILASGAGSVSYTAPANGVVRFYSHLSSNCDGSSNLHKRMVQCGTTPPPPASCVDFKTPSNNAENAGFLAGDSNQKLAIDLPIDAEGFTIYGFEPTVVGTATSFSFVVYDDAAGKPGTQVATRTGTISGYTTTANNFGYNFNKYTVVFDTPFTFEPNKKYWLEMISDALAWESTSGAGIGGRDAFLNDNSNGEWLIGNDDYVFNLLCTNLAVSESGNKALSFYPNPVKDILTINSKNKIHAVNIYNVAGQKISGTSKVENGKIDMSKFAPGLYIINTTFENGKNESFKVLKK